MSASGGESGVLTVIPLTGGSGERGVAPSLTGGAGERGVAPAPHPAMGSRVRGATLVLVLLIVGGSTSLLLLLVPPTSTTRDFYSHAATDIRGRRVDLEAYRGSVSLVVNVASECGYTQAHYGALQKLYRELGPTHFKVLAFPCNQFGAQEPGSNSEVEAFARHTQGASFPLFAKSLVLGANAEPALRFLFDALGQEPRWNFWKFLVDADGRPVGAWGPDTPVEDLRPAIVGLVRDVILKRRAEEL
uniref:Glutathione peroxidase n=1 Tax=Petromyzon marinus TaxID=7757 RepID=A0AAJ7UFZ0_PETMA|nr:glutathione peroxidase 7 [Petromyzon marinus]